VAMEIGMGEAEFLVASDRRLGGIYALDKTLVRCIRLRKAMADAI